MDAAIASSKTLILSISNQYKDNYGHMQNIETRGGAVTEVYTGGLLHIVVSDRPFSGLKDQTGHHLVDNQNHKTMHEIVGHAAPRMGSPGLGNAVADENVLRDELHEQLRAPEPQHSE